MSQIRSVLTHCEVLNFLLNSFEISKAMWKCVSMERIHAHGLLPFGSRKVTKTVIESVTKKSIISRVEPLFLCWKVSKTWWKCIPMESIHTPIRKSLLVARDSFVSNKPVSIKVSILHNFKWFQSLQYLLTKFIRLCDLSEKI